MKRRAFIVGTAAATAAGLSYDITSIGIVAQDATVTKDATVRARREFLSRHVDMRTDAYFYETLDNARAGFRRFSAWASKTDSNDIVVVENIEDITETDDGTFGNRGNPNYPEFGSNVWEARLYRGNRTDHESGGTVITMVLLSGPVVHVWRAITSVSDSLLRQIGDYFADYGIPKNSYSDTELLDCLPTVDDLAYLNNMVSEVKMTLEQITYLD